MISDSLEARGVPCFDVFSHTLRSRERAKEAERKAVRHGAEPVSQTYRFGIDFALVHTSGGGSASSAVVAAKSDGAFLLNTDPCGAAGGGAGEEAAVLLYAWSRFGGACGWSRR
ncbi:hypothetical protein DIPPA_08950 [Diplonema papillatum]|nr:hypothetical protein DIPPA_32090 [Diplonema papillatum]KAJ9454836.1 hypothetical protein DIPPA_08950 [Diplonema papillatum]